MFERKLIRAGWLWLALLLPVLANAQDQKAAGGAKPTGVAALVQADDSKSVAVAEDEIDPNLPPLQGSPIVLAGERTVLPRKDRTQRVVSILRKAVQEFGTNVADKTTTGERIGVTLTRFDEVIALKPKAVIVFTGAADEAATVGQDAQQEVLTELAKKLGTAGVVTFIVPSSPNLSAGSTANLRIAASNGGAYYVGTGTNIGGEPFEKALREIKQQVTAGVKPKAPAGDSAPQMTNNTVVRNVISTGTVTQGAPAVTPVPVNMRPPVALKQFDPKTDAAKPVTNTRRKKPSVAN